jgi:hypothetical protein
MVVFDLTCPLDHRFELWVPSAETLDEQIAKGWVSCPLCGSTKVRRLPAAPALVRGHASSDDTLKPADAPPQPLASRSPAELLARWWQLARTLKKEAEDVGVRFPEEARRIHYGEAPARPIKGEANRDEVVSLLEEGILVLPLPPDRDKLQ